MILPTLAEIDAELARRSFAEFMKQAWHVVEPAATLKWGWHLKAVCDHLQAVTEGKIRRLVINVPPGHVKSLTACVLWPAWEWIDRPWKRTLFSSYAMTLSLRDSMRCRDLTDSDWYRETLRIVYKAKGEQPWKRSAVPDQMSLFKTDRGGFRSCLSIGGGTTGFRGHDMVCDDPLNVLEQLSESALDEAIRWWDTSASSRMIDQATGARVIIMQRLHERDLSGHVLATKFLAPYDHLCLPSEYVGGGHCACPPGTRCSQREGTTIGFVDPRTEPGELLNPGYFPHNVIAEAKEDLQGDYIGQHQQTPSPPTGVEFQITWMDKRWHVLPAGQAEWAITWDLRNGGKSKKSSYAVGQVWMRPARTPGMFYLVDQIRSRWAYDEEEAQFIELCRRYPQAHLKLVEDKADGRVLIMRLQTQIPGIVAISPGKDKISRARATLPLWKAGNIVLPADSVASWVAEYVAEHVSFPRGANDDQVDTTTQMLNHWMPSVGLGGKRSVGYESVGRRRSAGLRGMF